MQGIYTQGQGGQTGNKIIEQLRTKFGKVATQMPKMLMATQRNAHQNHSKK